jgi:hypothetical protein
MAILNIYVKIQLKRTKDNKTYVGLALDRIVQISGVVVGNLSKQPISILMVFILSELLIDPYG